MAGLGAGVDELQEHARRNDEAAAHLEAGGGDRPQAAEGGDHSLGLMVVAGLAVGEQEGIEGAGAQEQQTSKPQGVGSAGGPAGLEPATRRL